VGFQTHVHGHAPARELLPGLVDLFVAAEELGLHSGWLAQHHLGNQAGRLPSPLVLLGAVAERTTRIRFGTTVVVLPLEDPLRLAEDAAVLDALSGGRLELGLGTGGPSAAEFSVFGADPALRHELYQEKSARLRAILRGDELPGGVALAPEGRGLLERIWEAPSTPERAAAVARNGNGLLLGVGTPPVQRDIAQAYRDAWRGPAEPRVGAFHGLFPGADRQERAQVLWPDVRGLLSSPAARTGAFPGAAADAGTGAGTGELGPHEVLAALGVHYGSVGEIVDSVLADPALGLVDEYVFAVQAHSTPIAEAIAAVETLATSILPELGWVPASTGSLR
jgi:alkanesulfonate monooxygenase SsuD/methylene tetrahydromethanopterin reductase-like flavin-dependent oxidoreductase (luciferase family)